MVYTYKRNPKSNLWILAARRLQELKVRFWFPRPPSRLIAVALDIKRNRNQMGQSKGPFDFLETSRCTFNLAPSHLTSRYRILYIYIYINIWTITPHWYPFFKKNPKSQKIDEFHFSIMCSGAQNRSKSNPLTQIR